MGRPKKQKKFSIDVGRPQNKRKVRSKEAKRYNTELDGGEEFKRHRKKVEGGYLIYGNWESKGRAMGGNLEEKGRRQKKERVTAALFGGDPLHKK